MTTVHKFATGGSITLNNEQERAYQANKGLWGNRKVGVGGAAGSVPISETPQVYHLVLQAVRKEKGEKARQRAALREQQEETVALEGKVQVLTSEVQNLNVTSNSQNKLIESQTEAINELKEQKKGLEKTIESLNQQIVSLNERVEVIPELQQTIKDLSATVNSLEQAMKIVSDSVQTILNFVAQE